MPDETLPADNKDGGDMSAVWIRVVTYEVIEDTLEEAMEAWETDGPETGEKVRVVDITPFVPPEL